MSSELKQIFERQRKFSEHFYDVQTMSDIERQNLTIKMVAALHDEVSSLLEGMNYRTHRVSDREVNRGNIKHEGVDVLRYLVGIMDVWQITPEDMLGAYTDRDTFLQMRYDMEAKSWDGRPVIMLDLDDVVTQFKPDFYSWLKAKLGVTVDPEAKMYYPQSELAAAGYTSEQALLEFIADRQLRCLTTYSDVAETVRQLYLEDKVWIHVITARPGADLTCKYDTYAWMQRCGFKCHRLTFETEKYSWIAKSDYHKAGKILCAVDDSSKNVREYARHGITCLAPHRPYNTELEGLENTTMYESAARLRQKIDVLTYKMTGDTDAEG